MRKRYLAALLAALVLTMGLSACGEDAGGETTEDPATTTTAPVAETMTQEQVVAALVETCASLSSYAVTEQVAVAFEANGSVSAKSEMTADVVVTPDAFSAVCEQALEEGTQVVSLYSADGRLYVAADDCRYMLELDLAEVLKHYGVVKLDAMPSFDQAALGEKLTMTETDGGYSLTCELSGSDIKGDLTALAGELVGDMGNALENSEIAALSVTAEVKPDGTPTRIAYSVTQNVLSNGNFLTVYISVDAAFTAVGEEVTLTLPDDLASYEGAQTAYRAIVDAIQDENGSTVSNASEVYDRLTATYGKELVDNVLYMIGVVV